ncbi:permease-like cell division protein FtsX [Actinomadura sp. ATCC 31491]|uniref:Permease-like cell division protein FtsX n=1 Tax=Actinomadura luzonensis TaxID=2805427 RepID=A0ABT0FQ11_9ACTN|nr:permease-like cell division protein FtsX [Actinomadura luzonensis]MCK2214006.1 permease-like cell division protein FtsX [Actinomadura luzonensis]
MRSWSRRGSAAALALAISASPVAPLSTSAAAAAGGEQGEISVFLCTPSTYGCHRRAATGKQRQAVRTLLEGMPELDEVRFVSRAAMYAGFRADFAANGPLLKRYRAKDLPEAFVLRVKPGVDRDGVTRAVTGRPGVAWVSDQADAERDPLSWNSDWDASVFLCTAGSAAGPCRHDRGPANKKPATARERQAIAAALAKDPAVLSYVFEDQKTAYQNFKEIFADNQPLIASTQVSDMPESYRLILRPEADWNTVTARSARLPGVSSASNTRCRETLGKLDTKYGLLAYQLPESQAVATACAPGTG